MDCEGYIPVAFVANFPSVASLGADYRDLLQALHKSHVLECDEPNETIRLREGWGTWLLPNASGGRGAPRYIKLPSPGAAEMSTAADGAR
ncbi:hypothetical protein JKP88DRAFT_284738 [Tribonema minus]|uniref:HTH La-type RNA-binding domain-containing protein n=1 Tax=Tribonema minus TaxID=303371 RepID=A0A836CMJ0_9STRA|nr:hypothetical protein JKP88DRAFT_284738 [Tribonema minus]